MSLPTSSLVTDSTQPASIQSSAVEHECVHDVLRSDDILAEHLHLNKCSACRESVQNATHEELVASGNRAYIELLEVKQALQKRYEELRAQYNALLKQIAEQQPELYNSRYRFWRQSSFLKNLEIRQRNA
ncbi:hypothetical protein BJ165DRAFT_1129445 [Panaeolus papilionaceus]|nr:hypothetical protein BJ165DRAFT_1129445 [Panaeolus papilionaceus]